LRRDHYIILQKLFEPDLLATILKRIESAPSVQKEDDGGVESIIDDPHTYNLFLFLLNTQEFQRLVQRITGCHRIADIQGHLPAQYDHWRPNRLVHGCVRPPHSDVFPEFDGARVSLRR
jgi:hypothetical protein